MRQEIPVALTIAGSDSSAGAGAQADLKTFSALGVYGVTAITCVVAEVPGKVASIQPVDASMLREQLEVLFSAFPIAAFKTGMLYSRVIIETVANVLGEILARTERMRPFVLDPVMVATTGDRLLQNDALAAYERVLFPMAALITPNIDEAGVLLGEPVRSLEEMRTAGAKLARKYGVPILIKGGHLREAAAVDLLFADDEVLELTARREQNVTTHGTGCTYSAAIAAGLAKGLPLRDAVRAAKEFVTRAIARHFAWSSGNAPLHALNHFT